MPFFWVNLVFFPHDPIHSPHLFIHGDDRNHIPLHLGIGTPFVFGFVVGFSFGFGGLDFVGDGLVRGDVDATMSIMLGGRDGRSGKKEGKTQVGK